MYMSKHAEGEKRIRINNVCAKVDGYDPITKTIIQVHGCFWHGHDQCFQALTINPVKVFPLFCIAHPYCARKSASFERAKGLPDSL